MEQRYCEIRRFGEPQKIVGRGREAASAPHGNAFIDSCVSSCAGSERNVSPQLQDAHIFVTACRAGAIAGSGVGERATTVTNVRIRVSVVDVVERVGGVGPDL